MSVYKITHQQTSLLMSVLSPDPTRHDSLFFMISSYSSGSFSPYSEAIQGMKQIASVATRGFNPIINIKSNKTNKLTKAKKIQKIIDPM